ncbi:MAG TPA: hypothetical protein PLV68_06880 [Ilumatobacteraceae bacterium]|nr:hypothetical protein [Ilumatobacteraceae bacterium]
MWLAESGIEFVEVHNAHLKMFATGSASADKTVMTHAAGSRCHHLGVAGPANDDEADAWHLRGFGRVGLGLDAPWAEYQWDATRASSVEWLCSR